MRSAASTALLRDRCGARRRPGVDRLDAQVQPMALHVRRGIGDHGEERQALSGKQPALRLDSLKRALELLRVGDGTHCVDVLRRRLGAGKRFDLAVRAGLAEELRNDANGAVRLVASVLHSPTYVEDRLAGRGVV